MKNVILRLTLFVLMMATVVMASGPRVTQTLFIPIENEIVALELKPFFSHNLVNGGMIFELVQAALKLQNKSATLTTYPITKMVKYYITQEAVLAALAMDLKLSNAESKKIVSLPVALIDEHYIYYKPSHPQGLSFKGDLSSLKGLTYGAHLGEDTRAYEEAGIKVVYGEPRFLLKKLKAMKIDFIKEPLLSSQEMIKSSFKADKDKFAVVKSEAKASVCKIYFNLKNKNAKVISKKFSKALLELIEKGHYQKIVQKYQAKREDLSESINILKSQLEKGLQQ